MTRRRGNGLILAVGLACLAFGIGFIIGYALLSGQPSAKAGELDWALYGGIILVVLGAIATIMGFAEDH